MGDWPSAVWNSRSIWRSDSPARSAKALSVQRLLQVLLHQLDGQRQLGMAYAEPLRHVRPLAGPGVADGGMNELLRNGDGDTVAAIDADQMKHHVQRRRPAGAGQPPPVDDEDRGLDFHRGVLLGQTVQAFPMGGGGMAVQQPGAGEQKTAAVDGAQDACPAGRAGGAVRPSRR